MNYFVVPNSKNVNHIKRHLQFADDHNYYEYLPIIISYNF